jgi:hypothetical protein
VGLKQRHEFEAADARHVDVDDEQAVVLDLGHDQRLLGTGRLVHGPSRAKGVQMRAQAGARELAVVNE